MSRISDLVQDAELDTRFDPEHTVHIYDEIGPNVQERGMSREEHWARKKFIGGGSYGRVWLEHCVQGRGDVGVRAVKEIVKSPHGPKQVDYNRELEAILKFSNQRYQRCFVKSYGWFESDHAIFIAMEYFKHGDLQHCLFSVPPLPELQVQQITSQILEGLQFMHQNGYSHRDLKPGNILIRSKYPDPWWVKLGDFGISKRAAEDLTASSTVKGTLRYMAPELFEFIESSEASESRNAQAADMWALGEITVQMLTKEPTFKNVSLLLNYVRSPSSFPSATLRTRGTSEVGIKFINSIMQPKPEDRRTSSEAMSHVWISSYLSRITGTTPNVLAEKVVPKAFPTPPLEETLQTASGRWSTVSIAAPPSGSSTISSGSDAREYSTLDTTVSFPRTNINGFDMVNQDVNLANVARYFILKSNNETNIETSAAHGIWCCSKNTNKRLSNAYNNKNGPIFLIYSVNESRKFCGVAEMRSPWSPSVPDFHWENGKWEGGFLIEWLSFNPIGFDDVRHLRHKENGVPLHRNQFVLELCESTGREMMQRFSVPELVPQRPQPSGDMSEVGSLGVGRLGLATDTGMNGSDLREPSLPPNDAGRLHNPEDTYSSTSTGKRARDMEIDDSEDERRQRGYSSASNRR